MRFYLNNINNSKLLSVEISPKITETFDETLDSAFIVLKANAIATPYAPAQRIFITDDNDNIQYIMYLANDDVELFSVNPLTYKHKLTLTQNTKDMSNHLVRNSVFTQPIDSVKKGYLAFNQGIARDSDTLAIQWMLPEDYNGDVNMWSETITLDTLEKPSSELFIRFKLFGVSVNAGSPRTYQLSQKGNMTSLATAFKPFTIDLYHNGIMVASHNVTLYETLNQFYVEPTFTSAIKADPSGVWELKTNGDFLIHPTPSDSTIGGCTRWLWQIDYKIETYIYSAYDILDIVRNREKKRVLGTNPINPDALFEMPALNSELYNLLKNTIAPNFTFTGQTMYECIADVFQLFDAIFTLDENNVLGIEYFNEYNTNITATTNFTSKVSHHSEEKYKNGIINFYQNAVIEQNYPYKNGDKVKYAPPRATGLGVPTSTTDFAFQTPNKINYVNELLTHNIKCSIYGYNSVDTTREELDLVYDGEITFDLTSFIYESSIWSLLSNGDTLTLTNNQQKIQANTLYFTKNDNKIILGLTYKTGGIDNEFFTFTTLLRYAMLRFFGMKYDDGIYDISIDTVVNPSISNSYYTSDFTNIELFINYQASVDGSLQIQSPNNKHNGSIVVAQGNGEVDINKLGLNMLGLSMKLGEPTLTATLPICDFANRIRKGQYIVINGERWVANVIQHTLFNNDKVQSLVDFVKNFNALSQFLKVNRSKRMSLISSELVTKSEILYNDFIYMSTKKENINEATYEAPRFNSSFRGLLAKTIYPNFDTSLIGAIEYAMVDALDGTDYPYEFDDAGNTNYTQNIAIPFVKYGAGNSLCFEVAFTHPKSAGNKTITYESRWWFDKTKYYTNYVPYTDKNGYAEVMRVQFNNSKNEGVEKNYPILSNITNDNNFIDIKIVTRKQPNEIFALNYQVSILSLDKDFFINANFINNNVAVSDKTPTLKYLYYSTTETHQPLDTKVIDGATRVNITNIGFITQDGNKTLMITLGASVPSGIKSWSIADEYGNLYLSSNNAFTGTTLYIYYYEVHNRIE